MGSAFCAGYHYYPSRDQAMAWVREAGFEVIDEGSNQEQGRGYWRLLLHAP
jgi:hypothetical protein